MQRVYLNPGELENLRVISQLKSIPIRERRRADALIRAYSTQRTVPLSEIAQELGVSRRSINNWINRLQKHGVANLTGDYERQGRPKYLSESELRALKTIILSSPARSGALRIGPLVTKELNKIIPSGVLRYWIYKIRNRP